MTDLKVNIEKIIHAPIDKVFDAWLNPKMLSKFMRGLPDIVALTSWFSLGCLATQL